MHYQDHQKNSMTAVRAINRGIALLSDESYSLRFIELQNCAKASLEIGPPLSLSGNLPHITLVQGAFSESTPFPQFIDTASSAISQNHLTTVQPTRLVYKSRGWIFLEVEKDTALDAAHRSVADISSSYLTPPTDFAKIADYSEAEKTSYRRFGYRYMYDAFYPHFTLGRVQSEPSSDQLERLSQIAQELGLFQRCPITMATIYEMGENGTHARTVLRHDLRSVK
jgi:hypothetical protein